MRKQMITNPTIIRNQKSAIRRYFYWAFMIFAIFAAGGTTMFWWPKGEYVDLSFGLNLMSLLLGALIIGPYTVGGGLLDMWDKIKYYRELGKTETQPVSITKGGDTIPYKSKTVIPLGGNTEKPIGELSPSLARHNWEAVNNPFFPGEMRWHRHNIEHIMQYYGIQKMIEENNSLLEMALLHMDERAIIVLRDRIKTLNEMFGELGKSH